MFTGSPPDLRRKVIILGDSILYHAVKRRLLHWEHAADFGLEYTDVIIRARSGRSLTNITREINTIKADLSDPVRVDKRPPHMIIICLGANDIAARCLLNNKRLIKKGIALISEVFPQCHIVWSDILPQLEFPEGYLSQAGANIRMSLNNRGRHFAHSFLTHANIKVSMPVFFDNIHLNDEGLDRFLDNIRRFFIA